MANFDPSATAATTTTTPIGASFANSSGWYNLTSWTVNVTRYAPSFEDLVLAGPRMFIKLGSFMGSDAEEPRLPPTAAAEDLAQAAATNQNYYNIMDLGSAGGSVSEDLAVQASRLAGDSSRGLGSLFSYATSRWALGCVVMAVILNRTHVYAATRRRLKFRWPVRLLLRILPIIFVSFHSVQLLQAMQCQTSADFALLRWGDPSKSSDLMFSHKNRFFNGLGSLILGITDEQACRGVKMIPSSEDGTIRDLHGSLSILWPLFGSFALSHFVETLSCAVQGRTLAYETAMTLFEQSLAFAEADAAVSNQIGWGIFSKKTSVGGTIALTRSMIMRRVNTSPEVLFAAFLSAMTHLSCHMLGVVDLQARYRLVNTGFWAMCFMSTLVYSTYTFDLDDPSSQGLLRYPTVCIIGLVPHILVLMGIIVCLFIYAIGLFLSALSPPEGTQASMTFPQRIKHAHQNMQANVSLSEIRITREMDIYTALLRTGFAAVTMASEAVYLNEDRGLSLKQHTWLEEERLQEAEELQKQWAGLGLTTSRYDQVGAIGLVPAEGGATPSTNGFARERVAQKAPKGRADRSRRVGVGASERSARWLMALELFLNVTKLFARIFAIFTLWVLKIARIRTKPEWLLRLARRTKRQRDDATVSAKAEGSSAPVSTGPREATESDVLDIEAEIRRTGDIHDEDHLDTDLYNYWLSGGWWGSKDSSGDFRPNPVEDDWDTTSIISASTAATDATSEVDWESDNDDGMKTPTQRSPRGSRAGTPIMDSPFSMNDLARLLQPSSPSERENAKTLAAHFQSDRVLTRSSYRRLEQLQRTRVLTSSGTGPHPLSSGIGNAPGRSTKLSPDEEEQLLEQLLLARRQAAVASKSNNGPASQSWRDGADGMGSDGPQCVVCQSAPRSIIVWPCRCLSLCDDCRVSLAMNNFDKCVCCRREVISFSRIFVP